MTNFPALLTAFARSSHDDDSAAVFEWLREKPADDGKFCHCCCCGGGGGPATLPDAASWQNIQQQLITLDACFMTNGNGIVVSTMASINEVNLRRAWLVLRWATVSGFNSRYRTFISVCNQPPRPTQPSIPPGSVNEYQLRLGKKRQYAWFIPLADERGVCR